MSQPLRLRLIWTTILRLRWTTPVTWTIIQTPKIIANISGQTNIRTHNDQPDPIKTIAIEIQNRRERKPPKMAKSNCFSTKTNRKDWTEPELTSGPWLPSFTLGIWGLLSSTIFWNLETLLLSCGRFLGTASIMKVKVKYICVGRLKGREEICCCRPAVQTKKTKKKRKNHAN